MPATGLAWTRKQTFNKRLPSNLVSTHGANIGLEDSVMQKQINILEQYYVSLLSCAV